MSYREHPSYQQTTIPSLYKYTTQFNTLIHKIKQSVYSLIDIKIKFQMPTTDTIVYSIGDIINIWTQQIDDLQRIDSVLKGYLKQNNRSNRSNSSRNQEQSDYNCNIGDNQQYQTNKVGQFIRDKNRQESNQSEYIGETDKYNKNDKNDKYNKNANNNKMVNPKLPLQQIVQKQSNQITNNKSNIDNYQYDDKLHIKQLQIQVSFLIKENNNLKQQLQNKSNSNNNNKSPMLYSFGNNQQSKQNKQQPKQYNFSKNKTPTTLTMDCNQKIHYQERNQYQQQIQRSTKNMQQVSNRNKQCLELLGTLRSQLNNNKQKDKRTRTKNKYNNNKNNGMLQKRNQTRLHYRISKKQQSTPSYIDNTSSDGEFSQNKDSKL